MKQHQSPERGFNFWPSFSDVLISILFIIILFFFVLVIKVYLMEIIDVKSLKNELMTDIKQSLGKDSIIISDDKLVGNNHTILFKDSFLFDQGKAEFRDAKSSEYIQKIGRELKKFVEDGKILEIVVEGHTNSDPIRGNPYGNWNLSTDRAVTVVKELDKVGIILVRGSNAGPTRILSVSGFSQYDFVPQKNGNENKDESKRIQISIKYNINKSKF